MLQRRRFYNMDHIEMKNRPKDLMLWFKERMKKDKDLSFQVPIVKNPDTEWLRTNRDVPTITWIGHCTFLIQMNGLNILTDPVWTKWLSTYKRLSPPGIAIEALPEIDIVLISHGHYDHLSYSTIRKLPGNPLFLVPAGLGRWFLKKGINHVAEFEWWGKSTVNGVHFTFVPAQHWTKRTLFDTNTSHWGGWVLEQDKTIYFAGDSGYFRGFSEIGQRFTIDYALMPIGAYEPEWFMHYQHVTPEESIQAFMDTNAKNMIPMHYGAYMLADDTPKEALDRMQAEWGRLEICEDNLKVLKLGEIFSL